MTLADALRERPLDTGHRLLLEREALLGAQIEHLGRRMTIKEAYEHLKKVDDLLKDCIDQAGGQIIDEELGVTISYEHRNQYRWDEAALRSLLRPEDWEKLDYKLDPKSVDALKESGRYGDREIQACRPIVGRVRGPLREQRLKRSLR